MSILLDELIDQPGLRNTTCEIKGRWYIAQPMWNLPLGSRLREAWKVFRGRAFAYHFKTQEQSE